MTDTDADVEFVEMLGRNPSGSGLTVEDYQRILALARRGAAIPDEPSEAMQKAAIWALDKARERDGKLQESRPYTPQEKHAIRYRAMLQTALKEPRP